MKLLLSWLREFVDVRVSPQELAHLLTMSGSEVASVEEVGAAIFSGMADQAAKRAARRLSSTFILPDHAGLPEESATPDSR